jgi:hypothetical protein
LTISTNVLGFIEATIGNLSVIFEELEGINAIIKGDSEKFRVIQGTASPDGRFAIALGVGSGNKSTGRIFATPIFKQDLRSIRPRRTTC